MALVNPCDLMLLKPSWKASSSFCLTLESPFDSEISFSIADFHSMISGERMSVILPVPSSPQYEEPSMMEAVIMSEPVLSLSAFLVFAFPVWSWLTML